MPEERTEARVDTCNEHLSSTLIFIFFTPTRLVARLIRSVSNRRKSCAGIEFARRLMGVTSLAACNIEVGISLEIPPPDPREVRWELSGLVLARTPISFSRLHTFRRCPIAFWLAISILVLFPGVASAHPMGNF